MLSKIQNAIQHKSVKRTGLAVIVILVLVVSACLYVPITEKCFGEVVKTSFATAVNDYTIPDAATGIPHFGYVAGMRKEFKTKMQNRLKGWPVRYSVQSFQVFTDKNKGEKPPVGFTQPISGPSAYITLTLYAPFFKVPFACMVDVKTYEASTGTWIR